MMYEPKLVGKVSKQKTLKIAPAVCDKIFTLNTLGKDHIDKEPNSCNDENSSGGRPNNNLTIKRVFA